MTADSLEHSPPAIPTPSTNTSEPTSLDRDDLSILSKDLCMPIAIVGVGFRGPGSANNAKQLWTMILEGREAWSPIPKSRWNNDVFYHPDHSRHGTINVEGGHFLAQDVTLFDAPFFNMTSDEAAAMDPQQRLLLEVTYEGFENAGIPMAKIMGSSTACFVGCFNADYTDLLLRDPDCIPMYQCTNSGQSRAMTANRVSYFFDMRGPSVTVDTACSGSLTALHLACQSLRTGDASMAVAAGVNVILSHEFMSTMTMMKFLSPDGRCHTFDENASGYARGEGIGCLVLKPLRDAIQDHDPIRAIIRGSGLNQDGRTPGITLPSGASQEALMRHVYQGAGLDPCETDFVEAHGTGTQAGDHIETAALAKVFCQNRSPMRPLRVGSIKTNVGHLEGTSGVAGVIKAVLMLENRTFLPNRNFRIVNPRIRCEDWRLKIQLAAEPWECPSPHRVSVNSFGYGGSNAHAILEDAPGYLYCRGLRGRVRYSEHSVAANQTYFTRSRVYMFSGFDERSTTRQLQSFREYLLKDKPEADERYMNNLAYTLNERRTMHACRAAIVGTSPATLAETLSGRVKIIKARRRPSIGFVFTGQGAQWAGMGKELLEAYPVFHESIQRIDDYIKSIGAPYCMVEEILKDQGASRLSNPLFSQPICSALQIALVDLLASWGIYPDSVTGHSSGEIAAAYAAGALTMEDAMAVAYYRGVVVSNWPLANGQIRGSMLALGASVRECQSYLDLLHSGKAVVACINSPSSVTIAGDLPAIDELEQIVREKQVFSRRLSVEVAYHSHHMELVKEQYLGHIAHVSPRSCEDIANYLDNRSVSFFSSVTGAEIKPSELGSRYWASNLVGQVNFVDSLRALCFETINQRAPVRTLEKKRIKRVGMAQKVSVDALVEVGPHATLAGPIKQTLRDDTKLNAAEILYISVLTRKSNAITAALNAAATLMCTGYPVDSQAINNPTASHEPSVLVDLPPYVWSHLQSYWAEPRISKNLRNRKHARTDLLGAIDRMACPFQPLWRNFLRVSENPWLLDHRIESNIVYPAAGYIVMAIEAFLQHELNGTSADGMPTIYIRDISIQSALVLQETGAVETLLILSQCESNSRGSYPAHNFHIYSVTQDNIWTEHCSGLIGAQNSDRTKFGLESEQTTDGFTSLDIELFYRTLASVGLEYGPCFANIKQARFKNSTCVSEIITPDTAAVMPMNFQYPSLIHPCTLDSIIHTIFVNTDSINGPTIPIRIDEMCVSCRTGHTAGSKLNVFTETQRTRKGNLIASISVLDESRQPSISITGLRCRRLGPNQSPDPRRTKSHMAYELKWDLDVDLLTGSTLSSIVPSCKELKKQCSGFNALHEACALYYINEYVKHVDQAAIEKLQPFRKRQLEFFKDIATQRNQTSCDIHNEDIERVRSSGPEGHILCTVGASLSLNLTDDAGLITANEHSIWNEYWKRVYDDPAYETVSRYLDLVSHKNPMVSILEIEASTGGASKRFLQRLVGAKDGITRFTKYTATHPDLRLLGSARSEICAWDHCVEIKELDSEGDLNAQGFGIHQYDVVIIAHGLYTVKSKHRALGNIQSLLKPNGHLVLIDPLSKLKLSEYVIFANFPGPWKQDGVGYFDNDLISTLRDTQLSELQEIKGSGDQHVVIISRPTRQQASLTSEVVIIAERGECGVQIPHLQDLLSSVSQVNTTDLAHLKPQRKACVVLSELQAPVLTHFNQKIMDILKQMFLEATCILWVTRGGTITPINPEAGLITGLARTARSETGVEPIITLDLDAGSPLCGYRAAKLIYELVYHCLLRSKPAESDTEYIERSGALLVPRVVENRHLNEAIASVHDTHLTSVEAFHRDNRHLRVAVNNSVQPEGIYFIEDTRITTLSNIEVRIQVHAVGLSEQDAQLADSKASDATDIGLGCSGTVQAVGKSVHNLIPGDRVACLRSGTAASFYQDCETAFQKMPSGMSFETAAAIPAAYCTAFHAVHRLAKIKPGDRVLINSAIGAVGQATIEVCTVASAHVYALVESVVDKELLVSSALLPDERILLNDESLLKDLLMLTDDRGVKTIVNCDQSDNHAFGSLWRCFGTSGTFIQLHARKTVEKSGWKVPALDKNIIFATVDIGSLVRSNSDMLDEVWDRVARLLRRGTLRGHSHPTTYSISDIAEALDVLTQADHPDPIVLTAGIGETVKTIVPRQPDMLLRPDVSYMLVGGLGGIGRATAHWMADHGAKIIIFVSRRGLSGESSQSTIKVLKEKGVRAIVHACDISQRDQVKEMMSSLKETAPPIRGIIQGAMLLRDTHIEKMTLDDYTAVLQPKYHGTWNLHRYLPSDLDWFIMLSSISGIIGNATQAAYAAGSTFMDSFAAYRNSLGLPAVSLDLGVITDAGYLAENKELASKMGQQGFQGTDSKTLMSLIEVAIMSCQKDRTISQIITGLGQWKSGRSLPNFDAPLFSHFRRLHLGTSVNAQTEISNTLRQDLQATKSLEDAAAVIYTALSARVATNLSIPVDNINPTGPITEYGIDSHVAVELRNWISKHMEGTVPILDILASSSLMELAGKIADRSSLVRVEEEH
ncbi:polyketide synthase [Aspergillus bombycis]|uniref:Polyketide synthase n=1 Tax=Aspergillus bombycis TaxID=109264 RepID=A0A1F8AB40_9EURO|nr:polyketide synthase [Aspergillus bombycis]OGM48922.1 polyketide synthase [Aspergillus bombycis]